MTPLELIASLVRANLDDFINDETLNDKESRQSRVATADAINDTVRAVLRGMRDRADHAREVGNFDETEVAGLCITTFAKATGLAFQLLLMLTGHSADDSVKKFLLEHIDGAEGPARRILDSAASVIAEVAAKGAEAGDAPASQETVH